MTKCHYLRAVEQLRFNSTCMYQTKVFSFLIAATATTTAITTSTTIVEGRN